MTAVSTTTFDERALEALPKAPSFVAQLRADALQRFEAMPVPSQETEEWRYTDLSAFELDFQPFADGGGPEDLNRHGILASAGVAGERAGLQIQRNSTVLSTQRSSTLADRGVWFGSLDEAATTHPDLVEPFLHQLVPADRTKFTALHAAFRTGGTFLHVPRDTAIELPIQTLTYLDADGAAVFPHTLVVVEAGSEVTFIDRYASPDLAQGLQRRDHRDPRRRRRPRPLRLDPGVGERRHPPRDPAGHGRTRRHAPDPEHRVRRLLARAEAETILAEPGGFSEMLGVFFADEDQHFDHRSIQDHVAPNCTSDLLYKGALRDHSRAVYSGWVHVRPDAQKTNAMQTSRNIVLSEHAKADAIPNLEIEANDVRCGHAASVGPVDEDAIFYLMSRGIPRAEAERLIVSGFFQEVLDRVKIDEVREGAEQAIQDELERAALGPGGSA